MDSTAQRRRGHPPNDVDIPPPNSRQSSIATAVYRDIGSIEMSDTQNVLGNNNSITYIFNGNRRRDEENTPTRDARENLHDLATTARADHEIYCSQLLTKKRGYPLWVPGPGRQLPIEYRRQGIGIGDVGIITSLGAFNFLFNIFQPADHPINRGGVPQGFSPLSLDELVFDIQEDTVYGPETYLATSSVRMISMNRSSNASETCVVQRFESTAKEAAILIMPDGATTQDLYNTRGICDTISSNAENWYKYATNTRGRDVKNGDIRVVVGIDKVSSWGIATSACNTGQTASYVFKNDPIHACKWDCTGASGRAGPQKNEIRDLIEDNVAPQNQCIFIRTINFTLSGEMWKNFPSETIEEGPGSGSFGYPDQAQSDRGRSREGYGGSGSGSTSSSQHHLSSSQRAWHCTPSVNFEAVELGVNHPSAALHECLYEKFPDAKLVITEDMDWISVLNDDAVVFPEPADLCERILKANELYDLQGIVQLVRKNGPNLRPGNSIDLDVHKKRKITSDISKTPERESENLVAQLTRIDLLLVLPREVSLKILGYLDGASLCRAALVSKRWKSLGDDDVLWKGVCEQQHIGQRCHKCGIDLSVNRFRSTSRPVQVPSILSESALPSSQASSPCIAIVSPPPPVDRGVDPTLGHQSDTALSSSSVRTTSHTASVFAQFDDATSSPFLLFNHSPPSPWKVVYGKRMAAELNWRRGRCKTRTLTGHTDGVLCLQFHEALPHQSFPVLISGSYDRTVRVWNMDTGEQLHCLNGHQLGVRALQFDEVKLITASMDSTLKVWDWRKGKCIKTLTGHTEGVVCLDYDSDVLASGSVDSTVRVWDLRTGGSFVLRGHSDWVNSVHLWDSNPNSSRGPADTSLFGVSEPNPPLNETNCNFRIDPGKMLFSASDDGTIKLWNLNTRTCVRQFVGHMAQVQSMKLLCNEDSNDPPGSSTISSSTPPGDNDSDPIPKYNMPVLVSGSLDNTIKLWDIETGRATRTYFGHLEGVWAVATNKMRLASGSHDRTIKIWSRDSEKCLATLIEHQGAVSCLALAGDKLVSGSDDKTIKIWSFSD